MTQNFLACDRDQVLLMPVSLREWLPEDHLAWFVLESVEGMDLSAFYASYRQDGHHRAAHDPAMIEPLRESWRQFLEGHLSLPRLLELDGRESVACRM